MKLRHPWLVETAVALGAVLCVVPVALIFVTSFKADSEILNFQSLVPQEPTLENFREVLGNPEEIPLGRWFFNSVFISSSITLLVLTVSSLAAYGLARLELPGRRAVFAALQFRFLRER